MNTHPTQKPDYTLNQQGLMVFTAHYHLKRGYCCGNNCLNCPYGNSPEPQRLADVKEYHQATKHYPNRYAPGPGYMDWATQPNPFREYTGTEKIFLPRKLLNESPSYHSIFSKGTLPSAELNKQTLGQFFLNSLAISAWKSYQGTRWALRVNPSSGNLHPTEATLICGPIPGLHQHAAIYHYSPKEHALELRNELPITTTAANLQIPAGSFWLGLSSVHWREAWKYGERAFRYCQHDVGHALGALAVSAAALGWQIKICDDISTAQLFELLGLPLLPQHEAEEPDCLLLISPLNEKSSTASTGNRQLLPPTTPVAINWRGEANQLSPTHIVWPMIEAVTLATRKTATACSTYSQVHALAQENNKNPSMQKNANKASLQQIIQQRRSAVDFDPNCANLTLEQFYGFLEHSYFANSASVGAQNTAQLGQTLYWPPKISLAIFVHRVEGLDSGLYFYVRNPKLISSLRANFRPDFLWQKPSTCPPQLDFYLLAKGDARNLAKNISCNQDIAGDSYFSLGMIAQFEEALKTYGAWFYKRLFWEAGFLGQIFYLEAESIGSRATGIGCYLDDEMHQVLGLGSTQQTFQSLYHFTVGKPIDDERLSTEPAYQILK